MFNLKQKMMTKIKQFLPIIMLVAITALFFSCTENGAKHIPKEAFVVMVIDGSELLEFSDPDLIKETDEYKDMSKDVRKESTKIAELLDKIIEDPDDSGILISKKSYGFVMMQDGDPVFGMIIPINKKKLEKNFDLLDSELDLNLKDELEEKDDIKYFEPENGTIIGWNKKVLIILSGGDADINMLEKCMNLSRKESILSNKDFKKFHRNCEDVNLWISSDILAEDEFDIPMLNKFEELTGLKLTGNYGHIHIDIDDDEVIVTVKLRFNESIKDMDKKKLLENYKELLSIIDNPYGRSDDDYDDYDF